MKMCDICHQRIIEPYTKIVFTIQTHELEAEWDFCDEHARMVKGFLWNLKNEVLAMEVQKRKAEYESIRGGLKEERKEEKG